jgi:methionyl-tRNA formyltransferase
MRIVYCGSGEFGVPCLERLLASTYQIEHIFTQPAHPAGRGRHERPTPVATWAGEHRLPCTEVADINMPEVIDQVRSIAPDLLVVIAFGQKLSNELIAIPARGAVNVHASLLPRYRGAAPINWAIIEGQAKTGVSIITLASTMDGGEILGQKTTDIGINETAGELHDRLGKLAVPLLIKVMDEIRNGTAVHRKQNIARVSRAPKLKKSDGFIDWQQSCDKLRNKVRGLWPWPGAQANFISRRSGKCVRVTIARVEMADKSTDQSLSPGMIDEHLNVTCGDGALKIVELKPAGGHLMDFKSFSNGRAVEKGDLFMSIEEMHKYEP